MLRGGSFIGDILGWWCGEGLWGGRAGVYVMDCECMPHGVGIAWLLIMMGTDGEEAHPVWDGVHDIERGLQAAWHGVLMESHWAVR
jgi:hypothetical protein